MGGEGSQVPLLGRIGVHVEQLATVAPRVVNQLQRALADHAARLGTLATLPVQMAAGLGAEHGPAFHVVGDCHAGHVQQRRHDILPTHQPVGHRAGGGGGLFARALHQHGHIRRGFVVDALGPQAVVAQHVPVVGREHDDRVVQQTFFAQGAYHKAHLVVDVRAQGVKRPADACNLARRHVLPLGPDHPQEVGQAVRISAPVPRARIVHVQVPVQVQIGLERHQRRMGMHVGQVPEGRPGWIAPLDLPAHRPGNPIRGVVGFGEVPRPEGVLVVAHAVGIAQAGLSLIPQPKIVVVHRTQNGTALFHQHHIVETDPIPLRVHVELAHRLGLVAVVAEGLGQGREGRHGLQHLEFTVPVGARRHAGHQRSPRRYADGTLAVGVGEPNPAARQGVQCRGPDHRMSGRAHQPGRPVVGANQQHVGVAGHGGNLMLGNRGCGRSRPSAVHGRKGRRNRAHPI